MLLSHDFRAHSLYRQALAAGIALLCGCANVGNYAQNRSADFLDCFEAHAGVGYGLAVEVKATDYATAILGGGRTIRLGLGKRHFQTWLERELGIPFVSGTRLPYTKAALFWPPRIPPEQKSPVDLLERKMKTLYLFTVDDPCGDLSIFDSPKHDWDRPLPERFNLHVGGIFWIVGARIGFSPGELADFLAGVFGRDWLKDDTLGPGHAPIVKKGTHMSSEEKSGPSGLEKAPASKPAQAPSLSRDRPRTQM